MTKTKLALKIAYLYPRSMNIYGDRGNIIALAKRCEWHGISTTVKEIEIGEVFEPTGFDLVFAGGGQDRSQLEVAKDLQKKKTSLKEAVENSKVFILICGTYQLFGHYFKTSENIKILGVSILDLVTIASTKRKIGNVVIKPNLSLNHNLKTLVGFENHSGNTFVTKNSQTKPLGEVVKGFGNNGEDKTEGAFYKNCFGTYLHGSLLPKNPHFADFLITKALETKYKEFVPLPVLEDALEQEAHEFVLKNRG